MSKKLFVGGLSWNTDDDQLKAAFEKFGQVVSAKVITDRDTGRSRGFGFVEFGNVDEAEKAKMEMNDQELDGRRIRVDSANERERKGGGGGGGRRGNDGNRRGGRGRERDGNRW